MIVVITILSYILIGFTLLFFLNKNTRKRHQENLWDGAEDITRSLIILAVFVWPLTVALMFVGMYLDREEQLKRCQELEEERMKDMSEEEKIDYIMRRDIFKKKL